MNMLAVKEENGLRVASLSETNRLNATVASEVKAELSELADKGTKLVVDLSNVQFIDSTGIGVLISALKTSRQNNGTFQLCSVQPEVMSLLTLMKLDKVFDICNTVEDCK